MLGLGTLAAALLHIYLTRRPWLGLGVLPAGLFFMLYALFSPPVFTGRQYLLLLSSACPGLLGSLLVEQRLGGGDHLQSWRGFPVRWLISYDLMGSVVGEGEGWLVYFPGFFADYLFWLSVSVVLLIIALSIRFVLNRLMIPPKT